MVLHIICMDNLLNAHIFPRLWGEEKYYATHKISARIICKTIKYCKIYKNIELVKISQQFVFVCQGLLFSSSENVNHVLQGTHSPNHTQKI